MSARASCTSPEDGVKTGTAHDGCFAAVERTRFSHALKNLRWAKAAFAPRRNRTRKMENTRCLIIDLDSTVGSQDGWERKSRRRAQTTRSCAVVKTTEGKKWICSQVAQHRSALLKLGRRRHGFAVGS